ncbi:TetR/AcrR family transcriptional regulator [Bradyrhizobium sp. dw_411]|uniref:TetR/AcrR family transcriptional regulator n=1 Tax=Bradyrhizobium sp. dw_411 TaxID=2720082 RepID=UPI001BCF820B|nr:TetR/AcrR family transcriptional regulator [Bradyrhizobium sp. dw_411]
MKAEAEGRKPRADALRNRERLIDVAKLAFAEVGPNVSLEEIARRAEVGIGTLYRHFPTRDDIIAAVYRREVTQLADAAKRLLDTRPAGDALHEWLRLFVDYIATKKVIAPALASMAGGTSALYESSIDLMKGAIADLVERAIAAGDIRPDVEPFDLVQALGSFAMGVSTSPGWETRTLRLIDILMDGLRSGSSGR